MLIEPVQLAFIQRRPHAHDISFYGKKTTTTNGAKRNTYHKKNGKNEKKLRKKLNGKKI